MQTTIQINDIEYKCSNVVLIERAKNNQKYQLIGMDQKLLEFSLDSFTKKRDCNVLIMTDNSIVVDGEAAFFNNIEPISKNAKLTINFVN